MPNRPERVAAASLHRQRGKVPILRDMLSPLAEAPRVGECIAGWAGCIEFEARDWVD